MLSVKQASTIIFDLVQPFSGQNNIDVVKITDATGRILAAPVTSKLDFPHWDNSAMDGYAVRFADVENCSQEEPVSLEIIEEIPAGYQPQKIVRSQQAARIFTGAIVPPGADTIVMQENAKKQGSRVLIFSPPKQPQAFVRQQASYYQAGNILLDSGIRLTPSAIAVLAAAQCTNLKVYRRPRVAILSTGDELVTPEQALKPGQIVDSNQYALASFVAENNCIPIPLGIVPDRPEALQKAIAKAISQADVVLSTGGVSVGDYDYVDRILAELKGEIHIRSVAVKPGKPLTVATFPNCLYFGIPGNPVSALVSCWRFVQPALKKLSGLSTGWEPKFVKAKTCQELRANGRRETYLWGELKLVDGCYEFALAGGSHSSGNLINLAATNGLAVLPVGAKVVSAGELVAALQI
ncbi:molybdopterin molybdotransferase MoeA [Oscillatoria salina]|uniref:molybdopterin molybdotransferase MoeA n=1 Tax=Oscillatoria salina TaxID=331517 RepID=UPI0013BA233E|nr:gephyrin-like molybdotransferase Glp [Oscillatoria salina]MBZ8180342.1 molybdopterin molybdotransferase MoeA [Oscillatoria salina IIICB1]NET88626.1 molybdopterin molybdotransferase MoeA [Kamptonema sp. SIO1D9]